MREGVVLLASDNPPSSSAGTVQVGSRGAVKAPRKNALEVHLSKVVRAGGAVPPPRKSTVKKSVLPDAHNQQFVEVLVN
jgi:hypothetical protein